MLVIHRILAGFPPAVFCAIALLNGVACQFLQQTAAMFFVCLLLGESLHRVHNWTRITAWLTIAFVSCWGSLRLASQQTQQLDITQNIPYGLCTIQGTVLDSGPAKDHFYKFYLDTRTHCISSLYATKKICSSPVVVRIGMRAENQCYPKGTIIELSDVVLMKPLLNKNYYLVKNKINCSGKTTKQSSIKIIQHCVIDLAQRIDVIRQGIMSAARHCFSPQALVLVSEMFLGYPSTHETCYRSIHDTFGWWGLSHLLARSGLHLIMFLLLFGFLGSLVPLPFLLKHAIILVTIVVYTALSWPSVPFIRATSMVVWYALCLGTRSAPHPLHIIACVMSGMLLYQPWYLLGLDFQLSFALAFALALTNHANKIT